MTALRPRLASRVTIQELLAPIVVGCVLLVGLAAGWW